MAYSSGDTILDDHYNIFVQGGASAVDHNTANINTVMGTGTGDKGYGESTLSTVSAGSTITATQWVNLLNKISTAASHQGSTITAISNPSTGDTISAYTALSTNITTVYNNRLNAAASGTTITTGGTVSGTNTWNTNQVTTITVTFASANAARHYFNAGGLLTIASSRSGGTASSKNTGWTNLCSAIGTIYFSGGSGTATINGASYTGTTKTGGSGITSTLASTTGFHDLTTTNTTIFKQFDATYLYTSNYIQIDAKTNAGATQVIFTVTYQDNADTSAYTPAVAGWAAATQDESVDGTLTTTSTAIPPSSTYLTTAAWGTPTLATTAYTGS